MKVVQDIVIENKFLLNAILEKNQEKIHWSVLSANPAIFEYDYKAMKEKGVPLEEELVSIVFHPRNGPCFHALGVDDDNVLLYDEKATLKLKDYDPIHFKM